MDFLVSLFSRALALTLVSLSHNWPYLLAGILIAAFLKVFMDGSRLSALLKRFQGVGVIAAILAAVLTPLCSCGTTAVVLGMMASTMPWAPVVAFMVASPLSSPQGLFYSAGLFGWPFALFYFTAAILLGLAGALAASFLEKSGLLEGQARFSVPSGAKAPCSCSSRSGPGQLAPLAAVSVPSGDLQAVRRVPVSCGCSGASGTVGSGAAATAKDEKSAGTVSLQLFREILAVSKTLLPVFIGFAFLGFVLNGLIPPEAMKALFGAGKIYGVPLAATIGLPLYLNAEASMPLVRAFLDSGMSSGAVMAFMIAGAGTSVGAIAGALTIARWRVVGLVVTVLWLGAMVDGYGYNGLVALGLF